MKGFVKKVIVVWGCVGRHMDGSTAEGIRRNISRGHHVWTFLVPVRGSDSLGRVRGEFSQSCPSCGRRRSRYGVRRGNRFILGGHGGFGGGVSKV